MKIPARPLWAVVALCLGAGLSLVALASAQEVKARSERVELPLLRKIRAEEGPYRQLAYLVQWNGNEVVADGQSAREIAPSGGKIPVLVYQAPYPRNQKPHGLMRFTAMSAKPAAPAASTLTEKAPSLPPERRRLKVTRAIALENEGHLHRGYLVEWNGGEAFVQDTLSGTNFKAGDQLPVLVMRHAHPDPLVLEGILSLMTSSAMVDIAARESR